MHSHKIILSLLNLIYQVRRRIGNIENENANDVCGLFTPQETR